MCIRDRHCRCSGRKGCHREISFRSRRGRASHPAARTDRHSGAGVCKGSAPDRFGFRTDYGRTDDGKAADRTGGDGAGSGDQDDRQHAGTSEGSLSVPEGIPSDGDGSETDQECLSSVQNVYRACLLYTSRGVYEHIKDMKTIGEIERDDAKGLRKIAVPVGVIAGLIPSTNPTSCLLYTSRCV